MDERLICVCGHPRADHVATRYLEWCQAENCNCVEFVEAAPPSDDHPLFARDGDPYESHAAGADVQAREGTTATFRPGTHKHRILRVYAGNGPLTDTQAWRKAGIGPRSGAWHRCSDLLDARAIERVDSVWDAETRKQVRRCRVTQRGRDLLAVLDLGHTVKGDGRARS